MGVDPPVDLDDVDPLMPIGMFSRASLVSVKALRSYHEQGLLVPDSIDPDTGYRSYRVSQLTDAAIIKRLSPDALAAGITLGLIPAATCAVMTHIGGYESIGETYRLLGAWVARNERSADQPVREYYVVSIDPKTGLLLPDDQLRTEIAWPILPDPQTNDPERNPQ